MISVPSALTGATSLLFGLGRRTKTMQKPCLVSRKPGPANESVRSTPPHTSPSACTQPAIKFLTKRNRLRCGNRLGPIHLLRMTTAKRIGDENMMVCWVMRTGCIFFKTNSLVTCLVHTHVLAKIICFQRCFRHSLLKMSCQRRIVTSFLDDFRVLGNMVFSRLKSTFKGAF